MDNMASMLVPNTLSVISRETVHTKEGSWIVDAGDKS